MNKVLVIVLMMGMISCAPSIESAPPIKCKKVTMALKPSADLDAWKRINQDTYKKAEEPVYVALSSISPGYLSAWLYEYDSHIMFKESTECILCHHIIPNIKRFDLGKVKATLTFEQLKDSLEDSGYSLEDSFRHFAAISFDDEDRLQIKASTSFEPDKYYYSMAFFMAVVRNNGDDHLSFTFYKATYRGDPVIVIEVNGRYRNFYDFAQYPPLR